MHDGSDVWKRDGLAAWRRYDKVDGNVRNKWVTPCKPQTNFLDKGWFRNKKCSDIGYVLKESLNNLQSGMFSTLICLNFAREWQNNLKKKKLRLTVKTVTEKTLLKTLKSIFFTPQVFAILIFQNNHNVFSKPKTSSSPTFWTEKASSASAGNLGWLHILN